jgi:aldose 1-epimerase
MGKPGRGTGGLGAFLAAAVMTLSAGATAAASAPASADTTAAASALPAQRTVAKSPGADQTKIGKAPFGRVAGEPVELYTLTNAHGIEVRVMTYGATLVSIRTPDRAGRFQNIILGFDSLDPYLAGVPYFGATVGRYANRIAQGRFTLEGRTYQLPTNNGPNSLHGGVQGFDKRIWKADPGPDARAGALRLTYVSAAGEQGYPGELTAHVTYQLTADDRLVIEYSATSTAATPVNLANHAYFNLTGDPSHTILQHLLRINAARFTPVDAKLIPTGQLSPVAGTAFDFREPHVVGERIDADDEQLRLAHGYDHNWVLDGGGGHALRLAAVLSDPQSGRAVEIRTTQPGLQFYSGNFLDGKPAGQGSVFSYRTGVCLETQHFPDSPNRGEFPDTTLRPGGRYLETTVLSFRLQK